jgi:hypothetical protein
MKSRQKRTPAKKQKQSNQDDMAIISVPNPCVTSATTGTTYTTGSSCYPNVGNITISGSTVGGTSGQYFTSAGTGTWANPVYTTTIGTSTTSPSIKVTGDADFDGDVKIKGHSIVKLLEKMEDRLAILMDPDPEKLEKFQALKKAYDNYKLLEKLCIEEKKEG